MIKKDGRLVKWFLFQMYECSRVEKFLTDMAKKGWMFEKLMGNKFTFQPCDPKKFRFSVEIFDQSSKSNVFQNDATLTYIEYCEKAGWTYITRDKKIHVFYTTESNAVSIDTDDELTFSIINKNIWKENIYFWFILPFMAVTLIIMQIEDFGYFISNYLTIFTILVWIVLLFNSVSGLITYIGWYIETKKRMNRNKPLKYYDGKNRSVIKFINVILFIGIIVLLNIVEILNKNIGFIGFELVIAVFSILPCYISRKGGLSKRFDFTTVIILVTVIILSIGLITTIILITGEFKNNTKIIMYMGEEGLTLQAIKHDEVPITLEDYGISINKNISTIRDTNAYVDATIFAQHYNYYDDISNMKNNEYICGINYEIFQSDFQWVIDKYLESEGIHSKYDLKYTEVDPSEFQADKLYVQDFENGDGYRYIAVYGKKVLILTPDKVPTKEQIELFIKTFKFS